MFSRSTGEKQQQQLANQDGVVIQVLESFRFDYEYESVNYI